MSSELGVVFSSTEDSSPLKLSGEKRRFNGRSLFFELWLLVEEASLFLREFLRYSTFHRSKHSLLAPLPSFSRLFRRNFFRRLKYSSPMFGKIPRRGFLTKKIFFFFRDLNPLVCRKAFSQTQFFLEQKFAGFSLSDQSRVLSSFVAAETTSFNLENLPIHLSI